MVGKMSSHPIFKIRSGEKDHFDSALSLLNSILGENLYTKDSLRKNADGEDVILLGCLDGNQLIAVAMAGKLSESGINFYSPFGKGAVELLNGNAVGVLRNSAVKNNYRGRG